MSLMKAARPQELIRICHVQLLPLLTGVQRVMLEIFKYLNRDRFELHVACREEGPLTDELDSLGIEYHLIPFLAAIDPPAQRLARSRSASSALLAAEV